MAGHVALMGEADGLGDLGHGEVVALEKCAGAVDAALDDVLAYGDAHGFAEECLDVGGADSSYGCDLVEGEVFGDLIFDEGQDLFQLAASESFVALSRRFCERTVLRDEA